VVKRTLSRIAAAASGVNAPPSTPFGGDVDDGDADAVGVERLGEMEGDVWTDLS
jgi:hypothetical protein